MTRPAGRWRFLRSAPATTIGVVGMLAFSVVAVEAQTATGAGATADRGYVEAVAQSALGNITSQSFGVEGGVAVAPRLQVFGELGFVGDSAPASMGSGAQAMAAYLSLTQSNVAYTVKRPVTFGIAGVRYALAATPQIAPYVMAGAGLANVRRHVTFTVGGSDVTNRLDQLGAVLGTDLSGSETKPMVSVGGGVAWSAWRQLVVDLQFRYGRLFTEDEGTNLTRVGIGLGVRF